MEELDRWKATEFRTFLLYVGPVVLKFVLPASYCYQHFLVFHVAVTIVTSPQYHLYFVQEFGKLYGQKQLVYNVHTLSHLAEQCLEHRPLDDFSAFPFESHLGKMKKLLRSSNKPLAQLSRRLSEMRHFAPNTQNQRLHKLKVGTVSCWKLRRATSKLQPYGIPGSSTKCRCSHLSFIYGNVMLLATLSEPCPLQSFVVKPNVLS